MATFDQIKSVRLTINDPAGFIDFIEVATTGDLPAAPAVQTAYKVTANSGYYATDKTSGAVEADYQILELSISDSVIGSVIDASSEEEAIKEGYRYIIRKLGRDMLMVRNADGAESTEYQRLMDMYRYYKALLADYEDEQAEVRNRNTGRYFVTPDPIIGEGNV